MVTKPRAIKASNLTVGTWYKNNEIVPPDDRLVLCCARSGALWFARLTDEDWKKKGLFFWQSVAKPSDIFFSD